MYNIILLKIKTLFYLIHLIIFASIHFVYLCLSK